MGNWAERGKASVNLLGCLEGFSRFIFSIDILSRFECLRFQRKRPIGGWKTNWGSSGSSRRILFALLTMLPLPSNLVARRLAAFALPSLPSAPLPPPREAHLWCVKPNELKDASLLQEYMKILSPCEKENVLSIEGEVLQKCALLSRVLVRTTLSRYTDCRINPRSFKFKKNRFGKPEVEWQHNDAGFLPSLQFNISHTSSLLACGISVNDPIGIDVEEKQRRPNANVLALAKRFFSPPEVQYLNSLVDSDSQKIEFIKLWTLKEAYVKALGRGFSGAPFQKFTIRFETSGDLVSQKLKTGEFRVAVEPVSDHETLTANWQFALAEITGSHFAAICMGIDENDAGKEHDLIKLKVWKTLPYVEDECLSDSEAVVKICGLS